MRKWVIAAAGLLGACATGVAKGPPDATRSFNGDYAAMAQCVMVKMRRDTAISRCAARSLSIEEYEDAGQTIISCRADFNDPIVGPSSNTAYTAMFSGQSPGATLVEVWQHTTLPGVRTYAEGVFEAVASCES